MNAQQRCCSEAAGGARGIRPDALRDLAKMSPLRYFR